MEGTDKKLIKYLPYILQDVWEMGSSSEEIIDTIKKHRQNYTGLSILDLGSGKGAVSIKVALKLGCKCFGIDGIKEFVVFSNKKSNEYSVNNICTFETNDIRTRIKTLGKFDIIILGAIGPVLGDYFSTLSQLAPHLNNNGLVLIGDAYVEAGSDTDYPGVIQINDILEQIKNAGMKVGVTLNPHTPVSVLEDIIGEIDMVLLMSVNPGYGAQKFIEHSVDKTAKLRRMIDDKGLQTLIQLDGGVNMDTARRLFTAGADVLVTGNYVFSSPDPIQTIKELKSL
jgi:SAM-dependent methyltransferase